MTALAGADYSAFDPTADALFRGGAREWNYAFSAIWDPSYPYARAAGLPSLDECRADPFRLKVQKMLTVAFRQIVPENGFFCDLREANRIGRGRPFYDDDDPLPMLSILEEPFAVDQDLAPAVGLSPEAPYELIIQGFVEDNPRHPTDPAHYLMADVKRRLAGLKQDEAHPKARIFRFGTQQNSVISATWDGGVVRPADDTSIRAHFWLRLSFGVSEDNGRPAA